MAFQMPGDGLRAGVVAGLGELFAQPDDQVPDGVGVPALSAALAAQPINRKRADEAFEEGLTRLLASVSAEFTGH